MGCYPRQTPVPRANRPRNRQRATFPGTSPHRAVLLRKNLNPQKLITMLRWVLIFFIFAILAGALGFTGIAGASASIAQTLFFIFLVLFVLSLLAHLIRGGGPKPDV
jgi:uncharacterized membrane protein YtjA (UPF0391 family)